jgi:hypothetical protein
MLPVAATAGDDMLQNVEGNRCVVAWEYHSRKGAEYAQ